MFKELVREFIKVDFSADINYGYDQIYESYPIRFATVDCMLFETPILKQLAKREIPVPDDRGWINYYAIINDITDKKRKVQILCSSADMEEQYDIYIDLTEEEQEIIYNELDRQFREELNEGCEELLAEAREDMKDFITATRQ